MVAGLSVVHGLIPPHPAALLAVQAYHADIGRTIAYGLIIGVPTAIVAGPLFRAADSSPHQAAGEQSAGGAIRRLSRKPWRRRHETRVAQLRHHAVHDPAAGVADADRQLADLVFATGTLPNDLLRFVGNSDVALLIAVLVSFWTFGYRRGFNREQIQKFCGDCLAPIAGIVLIVGAGGGFGRVLMDSGISKQIVDTAMSAHLSPLLLGWFVAALIRLATGSATVAMTTACGIVAPVAAASGASVSPELLVLATGSGSLIFSHVNDGGFWLIKEYFGMTVGQTFKTWSLCETIISVMGLAMTFALATIV